MAPSIRTYRTSTGTRTAALPQAWATTPLTVVMPTYNEIGSLARTCQRVLDLPLPGLHLKVVDDNSPDGTGRLAWELADRANSGGGGDPRRMSVLHRPGKDGLGRAYADGMTQAVSEGAEYVLEMDADGSHPAAAIPQLLGVARATGCGLVVGSRYVSGGSLRAGHSAIELPIRFTERQAGASKMNLAVQLEAAVLPWRLRYSTRPVTGGRRAG